MKIENSVEITISTILVILVILLSSVLFAQEPQKIIYETDMCLDVDDVGALAVLHALANNGEAEILAVTFNEVHSDGAAAIDAINTWYGRADIPIGIYKGNLRNPDGSGYLEHVAKFPHDLEKDSPPNALDVYRQVLEQQPDSSVTIISVGFMNNLNDLLAAERDLVAQKVKKLVQMSGLHNDGFNLVRHNLVSVSENVIRNWPTPLVISQPGGSILTGDNLKDTPVENPVREAYYKFFGNEFDERPSWDQIAVLYGVRGLSTYFREITSGTGRLSNGYVWQMDVGSRSYIEKKMSNPSYVHIIEELMEQPPIGADFSLSASSGWLPFFVEFDASVSNLGGNRILERALWDFRDGKTGEGVTIVHEFSATGLYDVQLTVIDDSGDSLKSTKQIRVSDPVFSSIDHFGNVLAYERKQEDLWSTQMDASDLRLHLNDEIRDSELSLPGFCFVKDMSFSDFQLSMVIRPGNAPSKQIPQDYSILFGFQDEKNYNQLLMRSSTSRVINVTNGQNIDITRTSQKGIPDGEYYHVVLELVDNQLTVSLDDSVFLTASSTRLAREGGIGFGSEKKSLYIDDIHLTGSESLVTNPSQGSGAYHFLLKQNHPNPFNPFTKIRFTIPGKEKVRVDVYTIAGQKITTLLHTTLLKGSYEVDFDGRNLVSGVYIYQIQTDSFRDVKRMILMK